MGGHQLDIRAAIEYRRLGRPRQLEFNFGDTIPKDGTFTPMPRKEYMRLIKTDYNLGAPD